MKSILTILFVAIASVSFGQFNINFYQMQGATPQNMNYNPAIFPKAQTFVSLPVMSGIDLTVNNSFGMSDVFVKTGDSTLLDVNKFLLNEKEGAFFNTTANITDMMVGVRLNEKSYFTLFINERIDATFFYPLRLVDFIWKGNAEYLGEDYLIDDISYDFIHYREIGAGYGRTLNLFGYKFDVGGRLKLLNGTIHGSLKDNLAMSIYTDPDDYSVTVTMQDGFSRSAGMNAAEDGEADYFIFNKNTGFGVDLGAQMELTDKINVGLSLVDLGFINWKEDSETASFNGTSFNISGSSFDNMDQLADAISDSIESLSIDTVAASFTTSLNSRLFLNGSYRVTRNGYATAIMSNYFTQGKMKSAFGIGYTQELGKWLCASGTISAASQYGADLGIGLMLRGGFFQTYVSVDHIFGTMNIPEASGASVKFGVNFLFGSPD